MTTHRCTDCAKGCPFCGTAPVEKYDERCDEWWVRCGNDDCQIAPQVAMRDLRDARSAWDKRSGPLREPQLLDEREVKAIAKKVGLAKYMWDTEEGRMDLARFAHEYARSATLRRTP
jgi:hypothetical protein